MFENEIRGRTDAVLDGGALSVAVLLANVANFVYVRLGTVFVSNENLCFER